MNRSLFSWLALIVTLLLCFQAAPGQQTNSTTNDKARDAALRDKAFDLLASLADQLSTLQSAENRARMGSNIAGSLWPHDEKRARAVFKLVEDDIKFGLQVEKRAPNAEHTFQVFYKLRENTAERMAEHDPELALAFLKETVSFVNEYARLSDGQLLPSIAEQERQLELRLAKRIGAANPEVAIKLARRSLANGFSKDLLPVLRRSSKDKAQVLELYKEIVIKLRDADFGDWQTFQFAHSLAQSYTPPVADESTFRELIHIFVTKALAGGCGKQPSQDADQRAAFCGELAPLIPVMEKLYPFEARRLRHWAAEPDGFTVELRRAYAELNELAEDGSIEEVLSLTSTYPEMEGNIRLRAMWMAESAGDWEQAEKIASNYNGDPEVREAMDERLRYYRNFTAIAEAEWAERQKNLNNLPLQIQAALLLNLAHNTALRDKKTSLKVLAQLNGVVDALPPGKEQTEKQIAMAALYCLANSERGFAIVEALLPKLNELIAAGAKLDGYDARYLRDGEWNMTGEGAVGNILTILANNAGYFAWYDFDRAVTLAGQFERSEIRMMAQLKLAQGILGGPPKRFPNSARILYRY